ncbi:hypothetical protein LTR15_003217 [Elasticomyces elasticus]|nr:hypothetical protein LTR15_003217 [Elasticomyces elasticus]
MLADHQGQPPQLLDRCLTTSTRQQAHGNRICKILLERVQARDPEVKAWAWIEPSLILQQAKELDGLSVSERGPLFGLPIAVKDVILTKDIPTQYNSQLYETETPIAIDANCINTLRAQGALIFGTTSTTEFASSFCKTHNWPKAGQGGINAIAKAQKILTTHGAQVEDLELPDEFSQVLDWLADVLVGEGRTSFLGQYLLDKDKLHESIQGYVDNSRKLTHRQLLDAYDNVARLRPVFDELASKYDVIITPSVVDEAPLGLEHTGDMSFCSTWTILHVPAINLLGFQGANGLPIGLTAVGPRYTDRKLLRVAKAVGNVFEAEGGWLADPL